MVIFDFEKTLKSNQMKIKYFKWKMHSVLAVQSHKKSNEYAVISKVHALFLKERDRVKSLSQQICCI